MTVQERFKKLLFALETNGSNLAKQISVSQPSIARIINGENYPSHKVLIPLIEKFNVNSNWVLTGEGEMFISQDTTPVKNKDLEQLTKIIEALEQSNEESKKRGETMDKYIAILEQKIEELEKEVHKK
ncbi:helix-turn-helix domain-containing protein [Aureispira sp. CCB-E]|uniref:helix-turn-helix domain-containing protein n=1 Tax=Aureispira sp. CCB-E TaxID=3051121 RepID=UPI0028689CA3|nr:helix-turn-helix domain-containing protein [Aureispira sp. CCB-E]WMX13249.1 helix-turn-helix domain-containing protein [Aureispira sp. CCB-E]